MFKLQSQANPVTLTVCYCSNLVKPSPEYLRGYLGNITAPFIIMGPYLPLFIFALHLCLTS